MRVAYFTSTMGGAGHITMALAMKAGLERAGFDGVFRIFGPKMPYFGVDTSSYEEVSISAAAQRDAVLARNSEVARALLRFRPDVLLVDKFWVPLIHILPILRGVEAWLLLHFCPPGWLSQPARMFGVDPYAQYRRLIAIEPLPHEQVPEMVNPIVICNPEECHPADALKRRLGVDPSRKLTLVVQTGSPGEAEELERRYGDGGEGGVVVVTTMFREDPIGRNPWAGQNSIDLVKNKSTEPVVAEVDNVKASA